MIGAPLPDTAFSYVNKSGLYTSQLFIIEDL